MQKLIMRRENLDNLPPLEGLPSTYQLRPASESDIPAMSALLQAVFSDPGWTAEHVRQTLFDAEDVKKVFLIETKGSGELVATASVRISTEKYGTAGYVHWVAVAEAHRGQRLGYFATLAVLYEFVKLGCESAMLETDDHRLAAIKVYQSLGFKPDEYHPTHIGRWAKIADLLAAVNL